MERSDRKTLVAVSARERRFAAALLLAGRMSNWLSRRTSILALVAIPPIASAQTPRVSAPAPAKNYTFSLFSEKGFHSLHGRGASADLSNPNRIGLTDLSLTLFKGDSGRNVETVILSPLAVFEPKLEHISGSAVVRLVRDDLEVTGEDWVYDHPAKKILIRRNARIVFIGAELTDLLK
jgi:hypothetical protein